MWTTSISGGRPASELPMGAGKDWRKMFVEAATKEDFPKKSSSDPASLSPGSPNVWRRDPEDRQVDSRNIVETRDKMFDKTVADSFPASDPPSTLPDPTEDSFRS